MQNGKKSQNSSETYIVPATNSYAALGHSFTDPASAKAKLWPPCTYWLISALQKVDNPFPSLLPSGPGKQINCNLSKEASIVDDPNSESSNSVK